MLPAHNGYSYSPSIIILGECFQNTSARGTIITCILYYIAASIANTVNTGIQEFATPTTIYLLNKFN